MKVRNIAAIPATLVELGVDADATIRRAGLDPRLFCDPENVAPFPAVGRLVAECVRATGAEDFGLRVGARTKPTAMGLTALVSMNRPTVREALQVVIDTLKTSDTGGAAFLDLRGGVASFGYAVTAPNVECADQIEDGGNAIAFNLLRRLCGPAWRPRRVKLTREPPKDRAPFLKFFEAPVDFAEARPGLVFGAETLDHPVRDHDPDYARVLAPLLEEAAANTTSDFLLSVRSVIRSHLGAGALARDSVCRALGLSARTLAHRLESYGVSYSSLADEARYDAAQILLRKGKPIAEIAARLGFAEPSAFIRAFKSWSGTTPGRWRSAGG